MGFPEADRIIPKRVRDTVSDIFKPERIVSRRIRRLKKIKRNSDELALVVGPIASLNPITLFNNVRTIRTATEKAREDLGIPVANTLDLATAMQALRRVGNDRGIADAVRIQRRILREEGLITHVIPAGDINNSVTATDDVRTASDSHEITLYEPQSQEAVA